jgi:RND family efflux transporter MFP subunit
MAAHIKKRFKGWIMVGIVAIGVWILLVRYAAPVLQYAGRLFPLIEKVPGVSKILKPKAPLTQEQAGVTAGPLQEGQAQEEKKVVPVVIYKAALSDFEDTLPAMGTIKGLKEIELRFETNGVIEAINFKEGDLIKTGDTIAVLNQQDAILKLEYSQAKLKTTQTQMLTAKKKLEVHQRLYELGSIIKTKLEEVALEYENAKSQVASSEKEVAFAKQEIQKAYITSPIDGIMGTRDTETGEFVTSATKIGTVIDISSVYAEVGIIEKDMQKVALEQEATITVDAYPDVEFKGIIDNILPVIEGKSRTLTCKIKIDNAQGQLLPGMFARGAIFVFGQKGAIVLPNACLRDKDNDGKFDSLFVVDEENVAHISDIEIGYLATDKVVVSAGLEEGQLVVTEARGELQDGSTVEILETQEGLGPMEQLPEEGQQEKEMIIQ